ncbi:putative DNA-binding WGR domain protein [Neorhizobium huautlense]|uniref:DNA-binding WGR domain protein n=1 Tax=Neorhizobium huautlense TaxID=67774 RepID=A0ABT9PVB7_9HYPH|nr:hypothetical protein [Neorhizobium huautlense]MDP9838116.1 putative DNA-binding WGR domain protein [Neorhizobium huautlense]
MPVLEILGAFGSIASLVGLGRDVYISNNEQNDKSNKYLTLYIAFTELTSAWKKVHHTYHSNMKDFEVIRRMLFAENGCPRRPDEIAPAKLRQIFREQPNISRSLPSFERDIDHHLVLINNNIDLKSNQSEIIKSLNGINKNVIKILSDIRYYEDKFFIRNKSACEYINKIHPLLRQETWSPPTAVKIIQGFEIFFEDQQDCIMQADLILLRTIDVFDAISPRGHDA